MSTTLRLRRALFVAAVASSSAACGEGCEKSIEAGRGELLDGIYLTDDQRYEMVVEGDLVTVRATEAEASGVTRTFVLRPVE